MNKDRVLNSLELVKHTLKQGDPYNQFGICRIIDELMDRGQLSTISGMEVKLMIINNRPNRVNLYKKFTENIYWIDKGYWWNQISEYRQTKLIRIDFLTQLIEYVKNDINY